MDETLTSNLLDCALDLLARDGLGKVNADVVATRAGAGKAAIYRRWASVPHLLADAVHTCVLIPGAPDTGALRTDLLVLFAGWTQPLDRCERAAAALLGHAGRGSLLDSALDAAVVQPLAAAVRQITAQHAAREQPLTDLQLRLLTVVCQSLWWQRYTSNPAPATSSGVAELIDHVLLPITTGT